MAKYQRALGREEAPLLLQFLSCFVLILIKTC